MFDEEIILFFMSVVSFGEVFWDMLFVGKKVGGVFMNVVFYLWNFGF